MTTTTAKDYAALADLFPVPTKRRTKRETRPTLPPRPRKEHGMHNRSDKSPVTRARAAARECERLRDERAEPRDQTASALFVYAHEARDCARMAHRDIKEGDEDGARFCADMAEEWRGKAQRLIDADGQPSAEAAS